MKTCAKCDANNQDAARFCGLCLQAFPPVPGFGPETATAAASIVSADYLAPGEVLPVPEPWDSNYLPPAPQSFIEDRRKSILLPAIELLSLAFAFFIGNLKFYLALSITLSILMVLAFFTIAGPSASTFISLLAARQATPQTLAAAGSSVVTSMLLLGVVISFLSLIGRLAVIVATVELSKGYELSVAAAIFEALKKVPSFLLITLLQVVRVAWPTIAGSLLTAVSGSATPFVVGAIMNIPIGVVTGTRFSLAGFVFLDRDTRGSAALAESKALIGARWPNVFWRYFVFGLVAALMQAIPILGWMIAAMMLTPLSAIFPWLLYDNLKTLRGTQS